MLRPVRVLRARSSRQGCSAIRPARGVAVPQLVYQTLALLALAAGLQAQIVHATGPILPGRSVTQEFHPPAGDRSGIAVWLGTYARHNPSELAMRVEDIEAGVTLADVTFPAAHALDNAWNGIATPALDPARRYRLTLSSPDATPDTSVTTFWEPGLNHGAATCGGDALHGSIRLAFGPAPDTARRLDAGTPITQPISPDHSKSRGVRFEVRNFAPEAAEGLRAELVDLASGDLVAAQDWSVGLLGAETQLTLQWSAGVVTSGRRYALRLSSDRARPQALLVMTGPPGDQVAYTLIGDDATPGGRSWHEILLALQLGLALAALALGWFRKRGRQGLLQAGVLCGFAAIQIGYVTNSALFWVGTGAAVACTASLAYARPRRAWAVLTANTAILLALCLAAAELLVAEPGHAAKTKDVRPAYSFAEAEGNPAAFGAWWAHFTSEWSRRDRGCGPVQRPDPLGELPWILASGTETQFFDSQLRINQHGFRGAELRERTPDLFRIVCLGESTTMGQTIHADDVPWPVLVERSLQAIAPAGRTVEVINAGWAGYDIRHNAIRMRRFVLDLQPDLVISYHGYNGFYLLDSSIPSALVKQSDIPQFVPRPSRILAKFEHAMRVRAFRNRLVATRQGVARQASLLDTECARQHATLLQLAEGAGIPVLLCSFNMAVDSDSPAEVLEFYRAGFPKVVDRIRVNLEHTEMLRQLAQKFDGATFLDTSEGLDGAYETEYVDLVHFTQSGRQRLADHVTAGVRALLGW